METDHGISERIFVLGVGAQKAGTTWFHEYLASAPEAAPGPLKEFHVWDAISLSSFSDFLVTGTPENDVQLLRSRLQQDTSEYFLYFDRLMQEQGKRLTFDITPAYAGLSSSVFRRISDSFSERDIKTKSAFLLRDPVERCWSAARMIYGISRGHTRVPPEDVVLFAKSKRYEMRTRYDLTLASLAEAMPPDQCYVGLYEEMFEPEPLKALSRFCNVPFRPELAQNAINAREKHSELEPSTYATIARHYRTVYEVVARLYPHVTRLWPGYKYLS